MTRMLLVVAIVGACGGSTSKPIDAAIDARAIDARVPVDAFDIAARPYALFVPTGYVAGTPTPLVVLLHGYGANGGQQEAYFMLQAVAEAETFLYATPDGTLDTGSSRFWNATDACCDLYDTGVNDVAFLTALLDDVAARYTVDARRVYFVGHSNGGFMSHRMACERADRIAAIVSLAGTTWNDPMRCTPAAPVAVAQVHGTADPVIQYAGGAVFGQAPYPGAEATVGIWAMKNGCTGATQTVGMVDLVANVVGNETTISRVAGCPAGGTVELWKLEGADHIPGFGPSWPTSVWAFFAANPKP